MKLFLFIVVLIGFVSCSKNPDDYADYQEPASPNSNHPPVGSVALSASSDTFLINEAFSFNWEIGGQLPSPLISYYTIYCQDSIGSVVQLNWSMADSFPPVPFSVYANAVLMLTGIGDNLTSFPILNGTSLTLTFSKFDKNGLAAKMIGTVDNNNDTLNKIPITGSITVTY